MIDLASVRVVVVGLGASGFSTARALHGLGATVRATDASSDPAVMERADALRRMGVAVETGGHDLDRLDADLAVLSPGVPPHAPIVAALARAGIEMMGEVELAFRLARCRVAAVTGTNGKTTTTSLLAAALVESGIASAAGGNIGLPAVDALGNVPDDGVLVVEVSSFQLATIATFHPIVAVVLNVAEDHTDWHGSERSYLDAKARITENQGPEDVLVWNADDEGAAEIARRTTARSVPFSATRLPPGGIGVVDGAIEWRGRQLYSVGDVTLRGRGGLEDAVAATGAALELGADPRAIARAVKSFRPLAHRLEVVAEVDGVTYIDDSKATNPHATLGAVEGLRDVVLIAGGRSKGIDLSALADTVPPVVAVIAMGEAAEDVQKIFDGLVPVERATSMADAVQRARRRVKRGGSVLLSPGCASLDMYESYAARGEDFARALRSVLGPRGETGGDGGNE